MVDTSVFVSALLGPEGTSREIVRACLEQRLQPIMSSALFLEYESLLGRADLFSGCRLDLVERDELLNAFLACCRWTHIYFSWRPNLPDENDNHVMELAIAGGATVVVTKNIRDFERAELRFPGLRILRPEQLAMEIRTWAP